MEPLTILLSTLGPLLGVLAGGWVASRTQAAGHRREDRRHLADTRRTAYAAYLTAVREYVAYTQSPHTQVEIVPHAEQQEILIPLLDADGTAYRQRMDAAHVGVRLIAGSATVVEHARELARAVRRAAAARATHAAGRIPADVYEAMWDAESRFVDTVRVELGLPGFGSAE
ncbi:hypothetical protein [Catellatospora vulcania]|uniref:hypothetical protein n=1 Tax=Catellatospora vulcania TaxID=1460450 RepID=UPI0012D45144|nr:hypothetical protein [Catellatospora vulcania]